MCGVTFFGPSSAETWSVVAAAIEGNTRKGKKKKQGLSLYRFLMESTALSANSLRLVTASAFVLQFFGLTLERISMKVKLHQCKLHSAFEKQLGSSLGLAVV